MGRGTTPKTFKEQFCARVALLVEDSGRSYKELAEALEVREDTMRRYGKRLLMPHHLIPRFCEQMGVKPEFLFRPEAPPQQAMRRTGTGQR